MRDDLRLKISISVDHRSSIAFVDHPLLFFKAKVKEGDKKVAPPHRPNFRRFRPCPHAARQAFQITNSKTC